MTTTENVASQDDASPASDGAVLWLARTIDAVVANGWAPLPIAPGTKKPGQPYLGVPGPGRTATGRLSTSGSAAGMG